MTFTNTGGYTAYNVTLTVTDELGKQNVTTQRIVVGSTRRSPISTSPPARTTCTTPVRHVSFSATGTDPAGRRRWCTAPGQRLLLEGRLPSRRPHASVHQSRSPGRTLSFDIPVDFHQLSNTYYNVVLTVTDSSGLKTVVEKEIHPNLVTLTFGSNVEGARYTIDGIPHTGTYTEQAVVGVKRTLGAISPQTVNGQQHVFGDWEHGGGATQVITTPGTATAYTVNYRSGACGCAGLIEIADHLGDAVHLFDVIRCRDQVHLVGADVLEPAQHGQEFVLAARPPGGGGDGVDELLRDPVHVAQ